MNRFTLTRRAKDRQGNFKPDGAKSCLIFVPQGDETDLINLNAARFQLGEKPFTSLEKVPAGYNVSGSNSDYGIVRDGDVLRIVPAVSLPDPPKTRVGAPRKEKTATPTVVNVAQWMADYVSYTGLGKTTKTPAPIAKYNETVLAYLLNRIKKHVKGQRDAGKDGILSINLAGVNGLNAIDLKVLESIVFGQDAAEYVIIDGVPNDLPFA